MAEISEASSLRAGWFIGFGVLTTLGLSTKLGEYRQELNPPVRVAGLEAHDTHAAASLLGQFRTNVSSWLYLRADLYLHNGVAMRPLTSAERERGRRGVGSKDDGHERLHDDSYIVTLIPSPERDFRGSMGDVERMVRAWKDMSNHDHNDPKETMPLFRLMTWIDPYFITGWSVGAMVLARDRTDQGLAETMSYLEEGLRHNPKSIELLTQKGFYTVRRAKDLLGGTGYFRRAVEVGSENFQTLTEGEKESLVQALRWLSLCYRELGEKRRMHQSIRLGLKLFPEDGILNRLQTVDASQLDSLSEPEDHHH